MKNLICAITFLIIPHTFGMIGTNQAIENFLSGEFNTLSSISELTYLSPNEKCDEVVDAYVVGSMGSTTTTYNCTVCLVNDGGIATVDSQESLCLRD